MLHNHQQKHLLVQQQIDCEVLIASTCWTTSTLVPWLWFPTFVCSPCSVVVVSNICLFPVASKVFTLHVLPCGLVVFGLSPRCCLSCFPVASYVSQVLFPSCFQGFLGCCLVVIPAAYHLMTKKLDYEIKISHYDERVPLR